VLQLVSYWLRDEKNGQWVMIIDNVDNVETFFPSRKRQRDEPDAVVRPAGPPPMVATWREVI
jgi:hypothetical protein